MVNKFTTIAIRHEDKKKFQTLVRKEFLKHHPEYQLIGIPDHVLFIFVIDYYIKKWGDD